MLEIEFVLRGKTVKLDEVTNKAERVVLQQVARSLENRVGSLLCAEHGTGPRITATGKAAESLDFDLAGCCQAFIDQTIAALQ